MPAWGREAGGPLGDEEISDLVGLLRSWQKESTRKLRSDKIRGSSERGRALYALNCASCHGEDGIGNLGMGPALNNQAFLRAASDGFLWEAIAKGRRETPMFPSLQGLGGVRQLSPEDINDLVAFIRSWERP
jgi:cytochrome c oxidase cbb3-type subunit 3